MGNWKSRRIRIWPVCELIPLYVSICIYIYRRSFHHEHKAISHSTQWSTYIHLMIDILVNEYSLCHYPLSFMSYVPPCIMVIICNNPWYLSEYSWSNIITMVEQWLQSSDTSCRLEWKAQIVECFCRFGRHPTINITWLYTFNLFSMFHCDEMSMYVHTYIAKHIIWWSLEALWCILVPFRIPMNSKWNPMKLSCPQFW